MRGYRSQNTGRASRVGASRLTRSKARWLGLLPSAASLSLLGVDDSFSWRPRAMATEFVLPCSTQNGEIGLKIKIVIQANILRPPNPQLHEEVSADGLQGHWCENILCTRKIVCDSHP